MHAQAAIEFCCQNFTGQGSVNVIKRRNGYFTFGMA